MVVTSREKEALILFGLTQETAQWRLYRDMGRSPKSLPEKSVKGLVSLILKRKLDDNKSKGGRHCPPLRGLSSTRSQVQLGNEERGAEDLEKHRMRCSVCGSKLTPLITDLPFKVSDTSIVILKGLPVLQCDNCREYLLDDLVMNRVEEILQRADAAAELEIIRYAA